MLHIDTIILVFFKKRQGKHAAYIYDNFALTLKVDYTTVLETHWLFSNSKMTMIYNYSLRHISIF